MIFDEINEVAAAQGIAIKYCSGDDGDFLADLGHKDVPLPGDSPYATGVGGTSVALFADGSIVQTGWGTNLMELSTDRGQVDNPPFAEGFQGGPGGGERVASLPSRPTRARFRAPGRQIPDVSAVADPYTGFEILITFSTGQQFDDIGGTSLATPVFSVMWALLNQAAGSALGQAAPYIAAGSPLAGRRAARLQRPEYYGQHYQW